MDDKKFTVWLAEDGLESSREILAADHESAAEEWAKEYDEIRRGSNHMTPEITAEQRHAMCHALGIRTPRHGSEITRVGWRNHYSCEERDYLEQLVAMGLMTARRVSWVEGGVVYSVSRAGWDFLLPGMPFDSDGVSISAGQACQALGIPQLPPLSRSKKRYQKWLNMDGYMSFGEALKKGLLG